MTGAVLPELQFFLAAALLVGALTALLVGALWPWLRPRLRRVAPAQRFRWLLALAAAPLLAGVGQGALCVLPNVVSSSWHELDHHGLAGGLGLGSDFGLQLGHPHAHGAHGHAGAHRHGAHVHGAHVHGAHVHGAHVSGPMVRGGAEPVAPHAHGPQHACVSTPPATAGGGVAWLTTLLGLLLLSAPLALQLRHLRRHQRGLAALRQGADPSPLAGQTGHPVRELALDAPLAYADAPTFARAAVVLSRGLVAGLDAAALAVVIAHEQAHLDRGDPWWRAVGALLSALHLPGVGAALRADLALASEQACDDAAAAQVGDRLGAAEAVLAVSRLRDASPAPRFAPCPGFLGRRAKAAAESHTAARVEALLQAPRPTVGLHMGRAQVALVVLAAAALTHPLQHFAEGLAVVIGR